MDYYGNYAEFFDGSIWNIDPYYSWTASYWQPNDRLYVVPYESYFSSINTN
jgi:hypothetical protein